MIFAYFVYLLTCLLELSALSLRKPVAYRQCDEQIDIEFDKQYVAETEREATTARQFSWLDSNMKLGRERKDEQNEEAHFSILSEVAVQTDEVDISNKFCGCASQM